MRQKGNISFISLLNKVRIGNSDHNKLKFKHGAKVTLTSNANV